MWVQNTAQNGSAKVMDVENGDSPRITYFGLGFNLNKTKGAGFSKGIELHQGNADALNNGSTAGSDSYGIVPGNLHSSYSSDKNANARGFLGSGANPWKEATIRRIRLDADSRTEITAFGTDGSGYSDNSLEFKLNTGSASAYAGGFRDLTSPDWGIVFRIANAGPAQGTYSNSSLLRVMTTSNDVGHGALIRLSSSQRYKNSIQNLPSSTGEKVQNLTPRIYKRNEDGSTEVGLIAEEVYSVLPELVSVQRGVPEAVHYDLLSVFLLKEIQRLNARITALESA